MNIGKSFTDSAAVAHVDNVYKLDGMVPVAKAIPFGLQHVLAMFVANITPIIIVEFGRASCRERVYVLV